MAYRATFLSASSTAAQRQRAPRDRVAVVGSKLKGGLMFGAPLELDAVLAPLPDWDDARPRARAAASKGGAISRASRRDKSTSGGRLRNNLSSSIRRRGGTKRGGGTSDRFTRNSNRRRTIPRSSGVRGEVSAPVADFDNISDVTGISSNAISSDHDSQVSSQAHKADSSAYSINDSSSLSPSESYSGSSPGSSSSSVSTPPGSKLLPRYTSTRKPVGIGSNDAGYLRHTTSSARKHITPGGATAKGNVQSIHISRRGSIHIDRPLGSSKLTLPKKGKKSRGPSSKKKKSLKRPKTYRKIAHTKTKSDALSGSTRSAASPVDDIVDSIERKLKRERKRMMEGMERANESNMNRQSALKRISDAATYADVGGSGSSSVNMGSTQYFWNAGSVVAPTTSAGSTEPAVVTTSKAQQKRPATSTHGIRPASRSRNNTRKAKTDCHPSSTRRSGGSPHNIKIHRDGSVDIKFEDSKSPRHPVATQKKSVAFADNVTAHSPQTTVDHAVLHMKKDLPSSSSSSSIAHSFHPTSALDEGLHQERDMQGQSLREFWAERKENLARIDTILYGDGNRRSEAGIVPGAPKTTYPSVMQNNALTNVPLRSASPLPQPPLTVQDQLRVYTESLGLDNAVAKLEETNLALNAQLISQQRDMASIQEEMRSVTERALASSAELQDIKRREQERAHAAELRAAEDAAKRAEDAAEIERRTSRQLQIMEQNQRALSAQQAQKQRHQEGAKRAIARNKRAGAIVHHAQARPLVVNENQGPSGPGAILAHSNTNAFGVRADSLFNLVAEWMAWAQDCMINQACSSMAVDKGEFLAFRAKGADGVGNIRGELPPPVPFPAHFTEGLLACGDTSVLQPAARRLERTCAQIAAFMSMREKSRQNQFKTGMQNSRLAVTKAKRVTEAESKRKIAALNSRHDEVLKDLKLKAAKAVEAAGRERTEAVDAAKQSVVLAEQKADKAYRRGREEGDYELGRQKEKHATEMAETQTKMVKLAKTVTGLQSRVAELENEARPEALASAMQRITELEDALEEATEEARLAVDAQRQCEEDCADRVVRVRSEHDRRLLAMRNAHEQRLTIIQSKMTQLSSEHAALLQRVKDEGAQRARDVEAKVRREVERAALTAGINLRGEMDAKLNRAKTKYRVEVQRLRRMLARASRLGGTDIGDDRVEDDTNYSKHEDKSVGGLMGYDDEEDNIFRVAGVSTDGSSSSGDETKGSTIKSPQKVTLIEEMTRREEHKLVDRPVLGTSTRPGLLGERGGLPGLERSGADLINDSGLTSVDMSANASSRISSPAASPARGSVINEPATKFEPLNNPALKIRPISDAISRSTFPDLRISQNGGITPSQTAQQQLQQISGLTGGGSGSSYSSQLEAYLANEGTRSSTST